MKHAPSLAPAAILSFRPILWAVLLAAAPAATGRESADLTRLDGVTPDPKSPGFIIEGGAAPLEVAGKVLLPREVSSVFSFTVGDGPADTELRFAGGIGEAGGSCGFVKDGPGTLRIAGELKVSGFITVYDGTLDLSAATAGEGVRIHLLGDARLVPPAAGPALSELHVNGEKLRPGLWGPPGSVAAGKAGHESPLLAGSVRLPDTGPSRREVWKRLKYGIFSHYTWNGYGMTAGLPNADGSTSKTIDELADVFDVDNYVEQLLAAEAQYVVFTAWHSGTCPLFPSAAMAKWAPGRASCPKRDLLGDLLDACRAKGIRTFFYCHPYQPVVEPHNDWINDLFAELVDRYASRLDGLWLDENFQDCSQDKIVDYRRLMKTIKERNPDLVLTQNNGGFQAYGVDEGVQEVQWEYHEGRMVSTYQIFHQTAKSPEDMLVTTVIQAAANTLGGGIQWSIDAHGPGGGSRGGLDAKARPILDGFVKLFEPIAASVKDSAPSTSYPPPFSGVVVKLSGLSWGVATKSHDDTREYLHVLKPPAGKTLVLPPPADGKVFANARLLASGRPIGLTQSNRGIALTLPDGVSWQAPDTVIAMDVRAPGGVGLVNNTSRAVNYRGNSWRYQRGGASRDFRSDFHAATADGDSFAFTFDGTDVEWISGRGPDRGVVELAIDGVAMGSVDLSQGSGDFQTVFAKSGLARGSHTLTGTKRGGARMTVDAFKVSELINDSGPGPNFADSTRYPANSATLSGPWEPRGATWINGQSFSFKFHGTGVELFAGSAHGSGDLVISIDGQPHSTVHCHGGQTSRSVAKIGGLELKEHTLSGQFTNPHPAGFIAALDGFAVTRSDFWSRRTGRGFGELGDDVHLSEVKGATGSLRFHGSGVEIHATRDAESRTAHYTLDGGGSSLWVGLNHYSPVTTAGSRVFRYPNLLPGTYTVGFSNAANPTGVNFSSVRLSIDALRVFKGESSSASPLFWGEGGRGGSGSWDAGASANWHDGAAADKWLDLGAPDHVAVFAGKGGEVGLAAAANVNRLVFRADGYTLRGGTITLTGNEPGISAAEGVKATLAGPLAGSEGLAKTGTGSVVLDAANSYGGTTRVAAGVLTVGAQGSLGSGDLVIADGALCQLGNPGGAVADVARVSIEGQGKLELAAGVVEKVAGLVVGGAEQPAGRYSAASHPAIFRGGGELVVGN
jgi:autotransporter-associated beta strand protein